MFCVWCSLTWVLARPFGSGDSGSSGLSMHRVSAASENLDGSAIQTARSFEWPGRLNDGTDFSTTRSGRSSASVAFSYLAMNVANLLKRRPRAAHDPHAQDPHWYQVKHTGVHGGTSPPSSSAADLPPEEWVIRGGIIPRLPPDDDERSWGDLQGGDSRHPSARVTPPDRLWDPTIPNGSGCVPVVPGIGNGGITHQDGSMVQLVGGVGVPAQPSGCVLVGVSFGASGAIGGGQHTASQQTSASGRPSLSQAGAGYIIGVIKSLSQGGAGYNIGILNLDRLYGVLDIVVDVLSIAGLALALCAPGGRKRMLVIASTFLPVVRCTCPGCFGNAPSCTYDTNGKCPTIDIPVANAAAVAGLATAVAVGLTLTNVISARFLRIFSRAHLQAVMQLVRRPAPGSIFEIKPDTKLAAILAAVSNGLVTLDQATVTYAGFIDDESDGQKRAGLVERYKLLTATKDIKTFSTASATATDMGVFSWLWGKITNFVAERGMQTVVMQLESASSTAAANVLSTSVKRFSDQADFFEALNLFIMFCTALGLATAVAVTEFLEYTVFDTIRMRGKTWQVAHELFLVMLRRIEDSGGKLNMVNCINDTHLNTVVEEAEVSAKRHTFRSFPGKGEDARFGGGAGSDETGPKYNGKFTANSKEVCWFFNSGQPHRADHLHPDGACKRNHVCDKWVSNKGPGGVCKGTEGTKGHSRAQCDNPHRCDARVDK